LLTPFFLYLHIKYIFSKKYVKLINLSAISDRVIFGSFLVALPNRIWSHCLSPVSDQRQGCQIFLDTKYQNGGKYTIHIVTKSPNGHKMYKMAVSNSKLHIIYHQPFTFQGLAKFTQIGILGLKVYHLATLIFQRRNGFCRLRCLCGPFNT
jgi:hypothetical protein